MPERHCGWRCLIASWVSYTDSSLTAVADDTTANKSHFSKLQTHKLVFKVGWVFSKNFRPGGVYQKYPLSPIPVACIIPGIGNDQNFQGVFSKKISSGGI